jgi:hypothetical protein
MSLPKYKDLGSLTTLVDIEKEIFILQKSLFDLRIKKSSCKTTFISTCKTSNCSIKI